MGRVKGSKNKPKASVSMAGEMYIATEPVTVNELLTEMCNEEANTVSQPLVAFEGWINIYKQTDNYRMQLWVGSDIYPTKDAAKAKAQHNVLTQHYISLEKL